MNSVTVLCSCGREILKYSSLIKEERAKWEPYLEETENKRNLQKIFDGLKLNWCCRNELTAMVELTDILYEMPVSER